MKKTGKANHPHNSKRPEPKGVMSAIENDDIDALLRVLSVRQKRFAEEYVYDFNGTAAAIRAGYAVPFADRQAHILLKHRGVSYYIDYLSRNKETNITVVDENYIIQKIVKTIDKAEDIVNLTAVLRGLELLARHKGMLTDKQEITGKDGGPLEIENRRKTEEEAENFTNLIKNLQDKKAASEKKPQLSVVK
jgi:phage terminase small subunit